MPSDSAAITGLPRRRDYLSTQHTLANIAIMLATHGGLILWFALGAQLPAPLYLIASLVASVIHQRAMSEWIHEGGHFNVALDRRANEWLTNVFAGSLLGITAASYRATHFPHHARSRFFEDDDPDTNFLRVASREELRGAVLRDLCGLTALRQFTRFKPDSRETRTERAAWFGFSVLLHLTLIAALIGIGRLDAYVIYLAALGLLYPLHNRLRVYGQHLNLDLRADTSRTIDGGLLDRILWTSPRLLYHWEHHAHPTLPYRALDQLCDRAADEDRYSRTRWSVLRRLYAGLASGT